MHKEKEKEILLLMINIYCRGKHRRKKGLCAQCEELYEYACHRIEMCPFSETKTFCSSCSVHCYRKDMREKIKKVMKYSGPRMIIYEPITALKHVADTVVSVFRKRK